MDLKHIVIRPETENDYPLIAHINNLAFEQNNEGLLIEKLRDTPDFISELSLVAEYRDEILGHILFHPILINDGKSQYPSLALAPMCVRPDFQKKGIGGKLVKEGLKRAKKLGYDSVIVLGHPKYYPKFGFIKASKFGIRAPFDVPDEAFLALELVEGALKEVKGVVEYPAPFSEV